MWIKLRRPWFGPEAIRYRKGVVEIDDKYKDVLPPTAEIVTNPEEDIVPEKEDDTLQAYDAGRKAAEIEQDLRDKAEAERDKNIASRLDQGAALEDKAEKDEESEEKPKPRRGRPPKVKNPPEK